MHQIIPSKIDQGCPRQPFDSSWGPISRRGGAFRGARPSRDPLGGGATVLRGCRPREPTISSPMESAGNGVLGGRRVPPAERLENGANLPVPAHLSASADGMPCGGAGASPLNLTCDRADSPFRLGPPPVDGAPEVCGGVERLVLRSPRAKRSLPLESTGCDVWSEPVFGYLFDTAKK